jgi:hypothetical protein
MKKTLAEPVGPEIYPPCTISVEIMFHSLTGELGNRRVLQWMGLRLLVGF